MRFGFAECGDFVAIDPETKAASRAHKGSQYWRAAHAKEESAAREMLADALSLRAELPDLPSHQPAAWMANFDALAALLPEELRCSGCGQPVEPLAVFPGGKCLKCHAARFDSQLTAARLLRREAEFWEANRPNFGARR